MPTVATKPPADAPDPSDVPQYMSKAMTPEQLSAKYAELEQKLETDVNALHSALEKQGVNSRGTTDIFGREFEVPVDAEHKASQFSMMMVFTKFGNPHMRAFHTSWFGFFSSFFSLAVPNIHRRVLSTAATPVICAPSCMTVVRSLIVIGRWPIAPSAARLSILLYWSGKSKSA